MTCAEPSTEMKNNYFSKAKEWVNLFISLQTKRVGYQRANVTPYMHTMVCHIPMFQEHFQKIELFIGQDGPLLKEFNAPLDIFLFQRDGSSVPLFIKRKLKCVFQDNDCGQHTYRCHSEVHHWHPGLFLSQCWIVK